MIQASQPRIRYRLQILFPYPIVVIITETMLLPGLRLLLLAVALLGVGGDGGQRRRRVVRLRYSAVVRRRLGEELGAEAGAMVGGGRHRVEVEERPRVVRIR